MKYEIREVDDGRGSSPFASWFNKLDAAAAARVDRYIRRIENGNFGNSKPVGGGVQELKIDFGPGYRVYYGRDGQRLIILLAGGSKRKQSSDIEVAKRRWEAYRKAKG
ncbi:MAG: type II toxin-antitoxin system RelE/ParE family toxin [Kiritimatiellales bacterium]